ncbi:MAG: hypothetical protein LBT00_14295 [Spirochaetaceae bacterium]|jgi:hypothetical protein|nr:hypothetical protein [Spirochaetaceae bacterium]
MNKKFFIIGLTVLAGVSLFLTGCPTDSDDGELSPAEKAAQALKDALVDATVDGTTVTLTASVDLEDAGPFEIPAGVTLAVPATITLSVESTAALTVTGTLTVAVGGEIEVEGAFTVAGVLNNSGTITVEVGGTQTYSGATGTNTGTINIRGTSHADAATNLTGDGSNVVHVGGKASFDGGTTYQVGPEEATTGYALISGTFTFNNAGYVLNGVAKVKGTPDGNDSREVVKEPQTLTIGENSTLTLPDRSNNGYTVMRSHVVDANSTPRILGAAGASIVLEARGQLYFKEEEAGTLSTFVGNESWNNFYSDPTTKITAGLWDGVETYVWATNLGDGQNESGWVKQQ